MGPLAVPPAVLAPDLVVAAVAASAGRVASGRGDGRGSGAARSIGASSADAGSAADRAGADVSCLQGSILHAYCVFVSSTKLFHSASCMAGFLQGFSRASGSSLLRVARHREQ